MKNPRALILTASVLALFASPPVHAIDTFHVSAQPVTDINPIGDSNPANMTFANYRLYFTATDKHGHNGIYVKRLTKGFLNDNDPVLNRRPLLLRNLGSKTADNFTRSFTVNVADKMFYHVRGEGVYTTKGTPLSTILLLRFDSLHTVEGFAFDPGITPYFLGESKNTMGVVFAGKTAKQGVEPWVSNGKPGPKNTHIVRDINPGPNGSFPYSFLARPAGTDPDQLFFAAFGPTNFYQLYRTLDGTAGNTAEVAVVSRTDSVSANSAAAPYGLVLAANDVAFGAGPYTNSTDTEVFLYNTSTDQASAVTNTGVNPSGFSTSNGFSAFFAGNDIAHGNEPWEVNDFSFSADYRDDIVPGAGSSLPKDFKVIGDNTYWLANDGAGYHLYRDATFDSPDKIVTTADADIVVTEYIGVDQSIIYFVGDDGTGPTLWKVDNTFGVTEATQVKTGQGFVVKNPSHLAEAVNTTGSTFIVRVYFRCSGAGSEFDGKGEELWVYED